MGSGFYMAIVHALGMDKCAGVVMPQIPVRTPQIPARNVPHSLRPKSVTAITNKSMGTLAKINNPKTVFTAGQDKFKPSSLVSQSAVTAPTVGPLGSNSSGPGIGLRPPRMT